MPYLIRFNTIFKILFKLFKLFFGKYDIYIYIYIYLSKLNFKIYLIIKIIFSNEEISYIIILIKFIILFIINI